MEATERGKVKPLPCTSDIQGNGNANDPRNSEPSDAQLSWELSLLKKAFPVSECDDCALYDAEANKCHVLHGDVDQDECPALPELVRDAQRKAEDEHLAMGGYL
jgi:hypothetical protein